MIKRSILCLALAALCAAGAMAQTLTVWDFKYGEVNGAQIPMKQIDALFEQRHSGVKVNHVSQPLDTYYQIVQAAASTNQGPDVVMFHPGTRAYGFGDVLIDLGPYIQDVKAQFTPASITMVSQDGKDGGPVKLLPLTMQGFGIYYNKAYFKKAGLDAEHPPKTPGQFLAACEKLKAAGFVPITVGQTYTVDFLLRMFAAEAFGPNVRGLIDGSVKWSDPVFREAVQFVKTLADKGYLEKEGFSRPYFFDASDKFAAGGGAIFVGLLSDVCNWKAFADKLGAANVGYFPLVNFPDARYKDAQVVQPAGIGYGVMTWSKNQKLAAEYVKFYTTGEGAGIYTSARGALSPNTSVSGKEAPPALKSIQQYLKGTLADDYITIFTDYAGYEDDSNRVIDGLFVTGKLTTDQFITEYQKLIEGKH